jgi:hypothetical protein
MRWPSPPGRARRSHVRSSQFSAATPRWRRERRPSQRSKLSPTQWRAWPGTMRRPPTLCHPRRNPCGFCRRMLLRRGRSISAIFIPRTAGRISDDFSCHHHDYQRARFRAARTYARCADMLCPRRRALRGDQKQAPGRGWHRRRMHVDKRRSGVAAVVV